MATGQRERRNNSDDDDDEDSSWTHVSRQDEALSGSRVTDRRRTTVSPDNSFALDSNVESDALMSCPAYERNCFPHSSSTRSRRSPSPRAKDETSSGFQETISATERYNYVRTAGVGRPTGGEVVTLTSRGATSDWNNTVVLPVDNQRTSDARLSSPWPATSPQVKCKM